MRSVAVLALVGCAGSPPGDTDSPATLDGAVYELRFGSLDVEGADPDASTLIQGALSGTVLIHAASVDEGSVDWQLAFGTNADPVEQDLCSRTMQLPTASLDGVSFMIPSTDTTFPATPPWTLYGLEISGDLAADFESARDIEVRGQVDAREVHPLVAFAEDADALCEVLGDIGLACGACADGALFCADLHVTGVGASRVDTTVVSVDEPDCE